MTLVLKTGNPPFTFFNSLIIKYMKDFAPIVHPVFNFKGYYVRVLASVPWNVYLSLRALCASYDTSISDSLGKFVRFVAIELCYPLQVIPLNTDDEK